MKQPHLPRIECLNAIARDHAVIVFATPGQRPVTGLAWLDEAAEALFNGGLLGGKVPTLALSTHGAQTLPLVVVPLDNQAAPDEVRLCAADAIALLSERRQARCTVVLPKDPRLVQLVTEGVLAANHRYDSAGIACDRRAAPIAVDFAGPAGEAGLGDAVRAGWLTSVAALAARDLVTEPANILTPAQFVV
ncbi:MAG: hypothetical protein L0H54_13470, partial [Alcaligenaceae bacterium]|nr:hypothetical protein [Alcaligenaceae bacterium]